MSTSTTSRTWRTRAAATAAASLLAVTAVAMPAAAAAPRHPDAVQADSSWSPYATQGGYPYGRGYYGSELPGSTTATTTAGLDVTTATAEQSAGLVLVSSILGYEQGEAAGSGIVVDSDTIVTNHHVVEGATSVEVTVATTGETYDATVVGTDSVRDIAVLQLDDAPALTPVTTDTDVAVGDAVTAVGDAGGDGSDLTAAAGTVTALRETIDVQDEQTGGSTELARLIEIDADIIGGDSGGALLDADGDVVGMNVAASSGTSDITGYVIPIARVLRIADRILAGDEGGSVVIGQGGMLGISTADTTSGPTVASVVTDSPAASLGLEAGDVITSVDGTTVSTAEELSDLIGSHDAGDRVTVTWTDASGASQSGTATLAEGAVQ
ncbi:serine protease, S1-C subfamily, contains C-terminal PDZ domain [Nocardioides exalbidus]|uniref:Serine protease, S1-C subfamily, contains C-terminal PDZ domain n=1 Tax=Nocardioides exalbidus TaxID=402596 RepID=A0A1H4NCT4_9ACTN|nr:trypsin-like peptidase domain-containing protein [Nocardioides exalbidus]SEB92937.1 serine protease, S1-C subfamily, contains C-terminal PDZ domain [Nocardioides exalbidus]